MRFKGLCLDADTLSPGYKHSIYWWAAVLVEDFHLLWQKWHTEVARHIHQLSVQESLSTRSWKKNNLSDCELVLIFDYICNQRYGLDNLKQHWAALLLVWLTAVRPASFTVGQGYAKGEPLGMLCHLKSLVVGTNNLERSFRPVLQVERDTSVVRC